MNLFKRLNILLKYNKHKHNHMEGKSVSISASQSIESYYKSDYSKFTCTYIERQYKRNEINLIYLI